MSLLIPEIKGVIKKISIFPPLNGIKIIDIHRLMISFEDNKILPITIKQAKTKRLKYLRDISIVLSAIYISKDDKESFISDYFKISNKEYHCIIDNTILKYPQEIEQWQDRLKKAYSLNIAWDIEKDCILSSDRYNKLINSQTIKKAKIDNFFQPSFLIE